MTDKDRRIAELEAELDNKRGAMTMEIHRLMKERDQLRELCREMRAALIGATHASYASIGKEYLAEAAIKNDSLIQKADQLLGDE